MHCSLQLSVPPPPLLPESSSSVLEQATNIDAANNANSNAKIEFFFECVMLITISPINRLKSRLSSVAHAGCIF
jgi:hypothetical protein